MNALNGIKKQQVLSFPEDWSLDIPFKGKQASAEGEINLVKISVGLPQATIPSRLMTYKSRESSKRKESNSSHFNS